MSKKHRGGPHPVPSGNRPQPAGSAPEDETEQNANKHPEETFQEHDPKRKLGDFTATAEHARQQPSPLNDGETHSK